MERCQHQPQHWVQWLGTAVMKATHLLDSQSGLVEKMACQQMDNGQEFSPPVDVRIFNHEVHFSIYIILLAIVCAMPSNPRNGRVTSPTTTLGSVAEYSCIEGFTLVGQSTRTCQTNGMSRNGQWSGVEPICSKYS